MKITVCLEGSEPVVKEYDSSVMIRDIAEEMQKDHPYRIVLARFNRHEKPLTNLLTYDGTLELLDIRDSSARMCYQTSLLLLYIKAVHDLNGEADVRVNNSLSKGLFTTIRHVNPDEEFVRKVEKRMRDLVEQKLPITRAAYTREELMENLKLKGLDKVYESMKLTPDLQNVKVYSLADENRLF